MANTTVNGFTSTVLAATLVVTAGCSKSDNTAVKTNATNGPVAPRSVWDPDPARAGEFTQTLPFDKYQLTAPKSLVADPDGTKRDGAMSHFTWAINSGTDIPKVVLIATVTEDKKLVGEAQKNMKQTLINYTASMTNPYGLEPRRTTEPETGSLSGIPFTRYKWNAATKTGTRLEGLSYGGVDSGRAVLFVVLGFGDDADTNLALTQAVLATLKKQ
jgi:hypothetical protein